MTHIHAHTDQPQRASQLERDAISISQAAARTAATLNRPPLTASSASASASTLATSASTVTVKGEAESVGPELSSELQAWVGAIPAELGAGSARSYFAEGGPEDSSSSSDEEDAAEVLPTDTEGEGEGEPRTRLVVERDVEFGTTSEEKDALMAGRKSSRSVGRADRIAGIPAKASPFGLMARMSTHKARSRAGSPVREAEGIAGEDFFRAGTSRPSIPYRVTCHLLLRC